MKKLFLLTIILSLFPGSFAHAAPFLTADDFNFKPLIQVPEEQREELSTVQHPEDIKTESIPNSQITTTTAKTLQDAINDFIQPYEIDGVKALRTGAKRIFDSEGYSGYVATGRGIYNKALKDTNINAARISQRTAYLIALMDAKNELTKFLNEMEVEGIQIYSNQDETSNSENSASSESSMSVQDKGSSRVAGVLKGYVTNSTYDDGESTVYVTIVSTPKTMNVYNRVVGNTVMAENLRDGMNAVLAEIQSGVVPPVGGRTVTVPETGEMGLVGFGSAIVQRASSPAARANQRRIAERIAMMRAEAELRGIIAGDNFDGNAEYQESVRQAFGDFSAIEKSDPMNELATESDIAEIKSAREEFSHSRDFNEAMSSVRRGTLPPGVQRSAWIDDDGVWAYAITIYIPSFTDRAASDAQRMRDAQILKPIETEQQKQKIQEAAKKQEEQEKLRKGRLHNDSGEFKPGVSGTVKQDL